MNACRELLSKQYLYIDLISEPFLESVPQVHLIMLIIFEGTDTTVDPFHWKTLLTFRLRTSNFRTHTFVRQSASAIEMSTFYNYFNQSQNSSSVKISDLFCDWLKLLYGYFCCTGSPSVVRKYARPRVRSSCL